MPIIFGKDIKLNSAGQAIVAANGELALTSGVETGLQDLGLGMDTPLGSLFYDVTFGSLVLQWLRDEDTVGTRISFEQEVERFIEEDPRVEFGTVSCRIVSWDVTGITARVTLQFIGDDQPYNLVVTNSNDKWSMVIADVNLNTGN